MDNLSEQIDEIEALVSIYDNDWQVEDQENRAYSIKIPDGDDFVKLYIKLPVEYPSKSPPYYEISAPHLNHDRKVHLCNLLDEVYSTCIGEPVIYQWIEKIREDLQTDHTPKDAHVTENEIIIEEKEPFEEVSSPQNNVIESCPTICHGEIIVDRKSSFQGHAATVYSVDQVKQVLKELLGYRKIQQATHNIYAYRIFMKDKKTFVQDCDDDGESHAGGRLLHLLQILDVKNIIVVVSRWYGGIHLGPDRFRHINNAARLVLEASGLMPKKCDY